MAKRKKEKAEHCSMCNVKISLNPDGSVPIHRVRLDWWVHCLGYQKKTAEQIATDEKTKLK